ncbi:hypothetical protein [Fibrobacter sp. UWH4]|uniref:hypothetical protein n=1 Tax=Fibrobacter sp. UWH4 TaxID=1896210 RepID=UPI0011147307|nr:hypothetical protein [Fibrobacter sp. UWH4]
MLKKKNLDMNEFECCKEFYLLEKEYRLLIDELTENQDKYECYKGWIWLQSKLIYQPDILFVGINPNYGKNWNQNVFHFPDVGERPPVFFEDNNARYNKNRFENKREPTHWFEFSEHSNNSFSKQIVDIVRGCAEKLYPNESECINESKMPRWAETFGKKISFINLYPIATDNFNNLLSLLNKFIGNTLFPNSDNLSRKKQRWNIRKFFIDKTVTLIDLVKPKLIVCLGGRAYHDLTEDGEKIRKNHQRLYLDSECKFINPKFKKVIGMDRSGKWPVNALVDEIVCRLK